MNYVIVIAREGSGEKPKIYRGRNVTSVLNRIRHEYCRETIEWTAETDSFIRENYRVLGPSEIARQLKLTKNAVIGRYYRIKGGNHGA